MFPLFSSKSWNSRWVLFSSEWKKDEIRGKHVTVNYDEWKRQWKTKKLKLRDLHTSHTVGSVGDWTPTPKNRDEVNRREVGECDGWVCDLEAIGVPSIFNTIRGAAALAWQLEKRDSRHSSGDEFLHTSGGEWGGRGVIRTFSSTFFSFVYLV